MEEIHTIWHQIAAIIGLKQCTSSQVLGICLEFWLGVGATGGLLKIKQLVGLTKKPKKSKKKKKKKKR